MTVALALDGLGHEAGDVGRVHLEGGFPQSKGELFGASTSAGGPRAGSAPRANRPLSEVRLAADLVRHPMPYGTSRRCGCALRSLAEIGVLPCDIAPDEVRERLAEDVDGFPIVLDLSKSHGSFICATPFTAAAAAHCL